METTCLRLEIPQTHSHIAYLSLHKYETRRSSPLCGPFKVFTVTARKGMQVKPSCGVLSCLKAHLCSSQTLSTSLTFILPCIFCISFSMSVYATPPLGGSTECKHQKSLIFCLWQRPGQETYWCLWFRTISGRGSWKPPAILKILCRIIFVCFSDNFDKTLYCPIMFNGTAPLASASFLKTYENTPDMNEGYTRMTPTEHKWAFTASCCAQKWKE